MATVRKFQRPQGLVRGFFGLGPDQFDSTDTVQPTLDVDFLCRAPADTIFLTATVGATAPGAGANQAISLPVDGLFVLDSVHLESTGPATSGSWRMQASASRISQNWGATQTIGLFDNATVFTRAAGIALRIGFFLPTPLILIRQSAAISDGVIATLFNDTASVGNATCVLVACLRQIEGQAK